MKKSLQNLSLIFAFIAFTATTANAQCTVLTGPYTQDFESTSGSSSAPGEPDCWKYFESGVITSFNYPYGYVRSSATYANSGTNFIYMFASSSSTYLGDSAAFMSPKFDLSGGNYEVKLMARTLSTSTFYKNDLIIGVAD